MSDEEDYNSSEDEDYIPSEGEAVSEEENSGDEEDLSLLNEDGEPAKKGKRKRKPATKKTGPRKRTGGIKLEDEAVVAEEDTKNSELVEQIKLEQEQKKEEQEKKKADDLWSSFMSDVGKRPEKKPLTSTGLGSLTSTVKGSPSQPQNTPSTVKATDTAASAVKPKSTITVTKVYDFAGESVQVTKEIDVNSKEGRAELKKKQEEESGASSLETAGPAAGKTTPSGLKRPGGGLGGVLDKINKKPKMGTLDKSKIDWEEFKRKEGIEEELKIHNRGKQSYIERMNFLSRTDQRQFEIEKSLRLANTSKR